MLHEQKSTVSIQESGLSVPVSKEVISRQFITPVSMKSSKTHEGL